MATDAPNRTEALRLVIDERRREFAMLGAPRLIDLKRLNREDWFRKDIVHTADGETWTLPANDLRYIMPVPQPVLFYGSEGENTMCQHEYLILYFLCNMCLKYVKYNCCLLSSC